MPPFCERDTVVDRRKGMEGEWVGRWVGGWVGGGVIEGGSERHNARSKLTPYDTAKEAS
jgi:hypothetical protein